MGWQRCPADECIWVQLEDDFVLYHRASGKTHFLNAASEALLNEVLVEPRDFESVLAAFDAEVAAEDLAAYSERMTAMLGRLEHLGLVQRV